MRQLIGIQSLYEHHGIDVGDGAVIHYSKAGQYPEISRTSLESFAGDGPVYVCNQSVKFVPDVVVRRAESRLGERKYDLFFNNCEHFANWCTTGCSESRQLSTFGLRLDSLQQSRLRRLIEQTTQERSPEQALALLGQALGDVAVANDTLQREFSQAQHDVDSWHRVALHALQHQREDLARAALHRKVAAKKRADSLTEQIQSLVEMRLTLQRNQNLSEQRLLIS